MLSFWFSEESQSHNGSPKKPRACPKEQIPWGGAQSPKESHLIPHSAIYAMNDPLELRISTMKTMKEIRRSGMPHIAKLSMLRQIKQEILECQCVLKYLLLDETEKDVSFPQVAE